MVYSLTYRRPVQINSSHSSFNGDEKPGSIGDSIDSGSTTIAAGIPDALSFDRVISGGTCPVRICPHFLVYHDVSNPVFDSFEGLEHVQLFYASARMFYPLCPCWKPTNTDHDFQPCTTRDFMNYLIYIERSAENLQFFLWYRDYCQRFSQLSANERALSPEWTTEKAEADTYAAPKKMSPETTEIFKGTDFAQTKTTISEFHPAPNPFHTPPMTPDDRSGVVPSESGCGNDSSTLQGSRKTNFVEKANVAYEAADVRVQPCKWYECLGPERALI